MKKLVIYDSQYGNTQKLAGVIAKSIAAKAIRVTEIKNSDLDDVEILVVGSPTQGGQATVLLRQFLEEIPAGKLKNVKIAAFDTRFSEKEVNLALRLLIKTIGYAAPKILKILESKGGKPIIAAEGFIVKGKEGPIAVGEEERAGKWMQISYQN